MEGFDKPYIANFDILINYQEHTLWRLIKVLYIVNKKHIQKIREYIFQTTSLLKQKMSMTSSL